MVVDNVRDCVIRSWCEILECETATSEDNFFTGGGDSLLAIELMEAVESELHIQFPLEVLFTSGRLGDLVTSCEVLRNAALHTPGAGTES
ncbi:MAG: hypothetical protein HKL86_06370 [Acidimicrobiaceae bacterium]|nr:hypothetical protein [Acidimicrobiaceae bacterium]